MKKRQLPRWLVSVYESPWAAVIIAATLGLIAAVNHSQWRDEMNVWLIARDSPTFAAWVQNIHYDRAHPGLWHFMVAVLHGTFGHPIAMQIFHWLLGVGSLVLFWRYSGFSQWQKWLFTFGYLPFYEYFVVARNYAVGMFLLFAIAAIWPTRKRAYWPIAGLVFLLANSNIYALWLAIAIALTLGLELLFNAKLRRNPWDIALSGGLMIAGFALSLYFILPPSDVANAALGESYFYFDLERLISTWGRFFAGHFILIPNGTRMLDVVVCGLIALILFVLVVLRLIKKPTALTFYLLANGLVWGFTYVKFMPRTIRHFSIFYVIFIGALWLGQRSPVSSAITRHLPILEKWSDRSKTGFQAMICLVLLAQFLGGLYGFGLEVAVPYSASRATAAYIREANLQDAFIVASRDAEMAPLSGYLGQQFYYPERQAMGSYTLFFKGDRQEVGQAEVLRQVSELLNEHPRILLILTDELTAPTPGLSVEPIESFERSQNETYYLYWVQASP
jgi:hypothetical protein